MYRRVVSIPSAEFVGNFGAASTIATFVRASVDACFGRQADVALANVGTGTAEAAGRQVRFG